jgi:serine-type D-Ala-D-Ala carboxypeptidase (penicillin-binding protein 5/6)
MKRISLILLIIIFCGTLSAESRYTKKTDFTKNFTSKYKDYKAVMLVDLTNGQILYEHNAYQKLEIASLTKMMSILLVVEAIRDKKFSLKDIITASRAASKMGGTQIFLSENEKMSVEDLLKSAIMKSANDAMFALAEKVSGLGKVDAFVGLMNKRSKELKLTQTEFNFIHGLPPSKKDRNKGLNGNTSSCYDLVVLAEELIKYPVVMKYSSTWMDTIRTGKNMFELRNTSKLIRDYKYFDGLKTGFYWKAGFCIVATAKKDDVRMVAVVLGSKSSRGGRNKFVNSLVTWGFDEVQKAKITEGKK